jgi:diguanylate cyclase (GGDEF)-like protein
MNELHKEILVVHDSEQVRQRLQRILAKSYPAYRFRQADSGESALIICDFVAPDCILLKHNLPDIDGLECLSKLRIRTDSHELPAILLTEKDDALLAASALKLGAQGCLNIDATSQDPLRLSVEKVVEKMSLVRMIEQQERELARRTEELERLAKIDRITDLPNRRRFDQVLELEWRQSLRSTSKLGLLVIKIDQFEALEVVCGAAAAQACLRQVGGIIESAARRPRDMAARYGKESFAVILPETPARGAVKVAEKIRAGVSTLNTLYPGGASPAKKLTLSAGVASKVASGMEDPETLQAAAEDACLAAVQRGYNQIEISPNSLIPLRAAEKLECPKIAFRFR